MLTALSIIGSAIIMALPLIEAIHDLITDAPAARSTFTLIVLVSLALAIGANIHD